MIADLELFETWLKPQLTWNSYGSYMFLFRRWSLFLDGRLPTKETAEEFLIHEKSKGLAYSSVHSYMRVLKKYFAWKSIFIEYTHPELVKAKVIWREYKREQFRRKYIGQRSNGKVVYIRALNKRARPKMCELCSRDRKILYHHWDDKDYSRGLWLCVRCHNIAEVIDTGTIPAKYLELKQVIDEEADRASLSAVKLRDRAIHLKSILNGGRNEQ